MHHEASDRVRGRRTRIVTARAVDLNGWLEIKGNPISKAGVFPYLGREIDASLEPDSVYGVYRPADELADPECIESFKLLPFVDEHTMLGDGFLAAEAKGVHGVVGQDVWFDAPYLRGTLKVFSQSLDSLINSGKVDVSAGYRCRYDMTPGEFEGQPYVAVQRQIRGNHLALVDEGRMGPDVAVLDGKISITFDTAEAVKMADEEMKPAATAGDQEEGGAPEMGMAEVVAAIQSIAPLMEAVRKLIPMEEAEHGVELMEDEDKPAEVAGMDSLKALIVLAKKVTDLTSALDSLPAKLMADMTDRDELAHKLAGVVGVFDHKSMTAAQVAKYGTDKLGIKCQPGQERAVLDGFFAHKSAASTVYGISQDSANPSSVAALIDNL